MPKCSKTVFLNELITFSQERSVVELQFEYQHTNTQIRFEITNYDHFRNNFNDIFRYLTNYFQLHVVAFFKNILNFSYLVATCMIVDQTDYINVQGL